MDSWWRESMKEIYQRQFFGKVVRRKKISKNYQYQTATNRGQTVTEKLFAKC